MKFLFMVMASALLAACQTPTPSAKTNHHSGNSENVSVSPSAAQRVWQLENAPKTYMDWTKLPQANANMGCNNLNFKVELHNSGSLKVGGVMATRMYCGDEMAHETAFTRNITEMTRYRVENNRVLILENALGQSMRFVLKEITQ